MRLQYYYVLTQLLNVYGRYYVRKSMAKTSLNGAKVKGLLKKSFRLNLSCLKPYRMSHVKELTNLSLSQHLSFMVSINIDSSS